MQFILRPQRQVLTREKMVVATATPKRLSQKQQLSFNLCIRSPQNIINLKNLQFRTLERSVADCLNIVMSHLLIAVDDNQVPIVIKSPKQLSNLCRVLMDN